MISPTSMKGDWQKLANLSRAEWLILAQSAALFPAVKLAQRWTRLDKLNDRLTRCLGARARPADHRRRGPSAESITRLVGVAARRGPARPNCLQHALVLSTLLHRHGFDAAIRFGARKNGDVLEAHAWVELDGRVLNDPQDIGARYPPFPRTVVSAEAKIR